MSILLKEKVLKKDYCTIHYWIKSNGTGPWIIFLHGVGSDHRAFDKQIHVIPRFFNILLMDIRGHGLSQPTEKVFSTKLVVDDLITIMNIENCNEAVLVGVSMGGSICQELAFYHSSRVKSLVLIGCILNTQTASLAAKVLLKATPILFSMYPWSMLKKIIVNFGSKDIYVQNYINDNLNHINRKNFTNFFYEINKSYNCISKYKIKKEILLVFGEKDIVKIIKELDLNISSSQLCSKYLIIKDARHCANQDNPKAFNDALLQFLNDQYNISDYI